MQSFLQRFVREMENIDEIAHVLLKGHLLIEERFVQILEQYVFHREHLADAKLSFNQKLLLCRSFCLRKSNLGEWQLIAALNSLRNELAHNLDSPKRKRKLALVKEIYFREAAGLEGMERIKQQSDAAIVMNACGHCAGFLESFEGDSRAFREKIHQMDRALNPELPEFEL